MVNFLTPRLFSPTLARMEVTLAASPASRRRHTSLARAAAGSGDPLADEEQKRTPLFERLSCDRP